MKRLLSVTAAFLSGLYLFAQSSVEAEIESICRGEYLEDSAFGICAGSFDGSFNLDLNSRTRLVPASNVKLLTTGAALHALGSHFRYATTLAYSGEICDSTLYGNIHIVGGGDPSLGVCREDYDKLNEVLGLWKGMINDAGIARIEGRIVTDTTWFDGRGIVSSWMIEDFLGDDSVETLGFNWKENRDGDCPLELREYLRGHGTELCWCDNPERDSLIFIGTSYSDSLKNIVRECNFHSDNFYAECLLRTLGKVLNDSADYTSSNLARRDILEEMGLDCSRVSLCDGSGLSRKNSVSARFLTDFLKAMGKDPEFGNFCNSLPCPGEGTLRRRMKNCPKGLRERIRMKSGSMEGISCFSGYILPEDGNPGHTIAFSILFNNLLGDNKKILSEIDRIIGLIATEGNLE